MDAGVGHLVSGPADFPGDPERLAAVYRTVEIQTERERLIRHVQQLIAPGHLKPWIRRGRRGVGPRLRRLGLPVLPGRAVGEAG